VKRRLAISFDNNCAILINPTRFWPSSLSVVTVKLLLHTVGSLQTLLNTWDWAVHVVSPDNKPHCGLMIADQVQGGLTVLHEAEEDAVNWQNKTCNRARLVDGCRCRSVCLLMQTALPCMLLARGPMRLLLRGGTNAAFAPQIDYFVLVRTQLYSVPSCHIMWCGDT